MSAPGVEPMPPHLGVDGPRAPLFCADVARPPAASKTTPRGCRDLLPELLQQVYESMLSRSGQRVCSSIVLKHVVLVSKRWQIVAQPVFYRHLRFEYFRTAENFSTHVLSQAALRNKDVGQWVRTLTIWNSDSRTSLQSFIQVPLPVLLGRMHNLRAFSCPGYPCTHNELSALAHTAQATMRHLSILFDWSEAVSMSGLAFSLLGQFRGLQELKIIYVGGWSGAISLAETPGLCLAELQCLDVFVIDGDNLISLLCRSRFPRLGRFKVGGPYLDVNQAEALGPFFAAYAVRELQVSGSLDGASLVVRMAASATKIMVLGRIDTNARLMESLPETCVCLVISMNDLTYIHLDALLARMEILDTRLPNLTEVRFDRTFCWPNLDTSRHLNDRDADRHALNMGKVLRYGVLFAKFDVRIVDGDGGTMTHKVVYEAL